MSVPKELEKGEGTSPCLWQSGLRMGDREKADLLNSPFTPVFPIKATVLKTL